MIKTIDELEADLHKARELFNSCEQCIFVLGTRLDISIGPPTAVSRAVVSQGTRHREMLNEVLRDIIERQIEALDKLGVIPPEGAREAIVDD